MARLRQHRLLGLTVALALGPAGCDREIIYPEGLAWGDPPAPAFSAAPRLVVTNNGDDTLGFVSPGPLDAPQLLGAAPVGNSPVELEGPHHIAASPDGRILYYNLSNYVTGGGGGPHGAHGSGSVPGFLVKLDARTLRPLGQVLVDRSPGDVITSADGKLVFVSHYDLARLQAQLLRGGPPEDGWSSVYIIEAAGLRVLSRLPLCPTAHGLGLSPAGDRLYVSCAHSDEVAVVDVRQPAQPAVVAKVKVGPSPGPQGDPRYAPYALSVHPGGAVFISNNQSRDVWVLDPQALTTARVGQGDAGDLGGLAMFGAFSEDGRTFYVPSQGQRDRVTAIDVEARKPLRSLLLPPASCLNAHVLSRVPGGLALVCEGDHLSRRGSMLFLSDDGQALAARGSVELGLFPDGALLLPPAP